MTFIPPKILKINSDSNELTYLKTIPKTKSNELLYRYVFSKSITKIGMEVSFTEGELNKQMNNTFKEIA